MHRHLKSFARLGILLLLVGGSSACITPKKLEQITPEPNKPLWPQHELTPFGSPGSGVAIQKLQAPLAVGMVWWEWQQNNTELYPPGEGELPKTSRQETLLWIERLLAEPPLGSFRVLSRPTPPKRNAPTPSPHKLLIEKASEQNLDVILLLRTTTREKRIPNML